MKLTNQTNINQISSFIDSYANLLDNAINTECDIIFFIPFKNENPNNDPLICYANVVEYSEEICDRLGLSETEIHAVIAHEIGHILDKTNFDQNSREICADSMVKVLGLQDALVSGLRKLIGSGLYPEQEDMMYERIRILEINDKDGDITGDCFPKV